MERIGNKERQQRWIDNSQEIVRLEYDMTATNLARCRERLKNHVSSSSSTGSWMGKEEEEEEEETTTTTATIQHVINNAALHWWTFW